MPKIENSETCHKALVDYQKKYGDSALTTNEKEFLYGVITYNQFKNRIYGEIEKEHCSNNGGKCSTCTLLSYCKDSIVVNFE